MTVSKPPLLSVAVRLQQFGLTLSCRIANPSDTEWGLFTRIEDTFPDGSFRLSPDVAYVELVGEVLRVEKSVLAVPDGLQVAVKKVPLVARLPTGAEWAEDIRLPVPVRVCHPYRRAVLLAGQPGGSDANPEEPKTVREVEVVIGAFPLLPDVNLEPLSPSFPALFRAWPAGVAAARQVRLTRKVPVPADLMVLDYGVVKPPK